MSDFASRAALREVVMPSRSIPLLCCLLCAVPALADVADDRLTEGIAAFDSGKYGEAMTALKASNKARATAKASLYLGHANLWLGKGAAAKAAYKQALKLETDPSAKVALKDLLAALGKNKLALAAVFTDPAGAKVSVNELSQPLGYTPLRAPLAAGKHSLKIELEGYDTVSEEVVLATGTPTVIERKLTSSDCPLQISTIPASSVVSVGGLQRVAVPRGEHVVSLAAEGFKPTTIKVTCTDGKPIKAQARLEALTGQVLPVTLPSGAVATIDGQPVNLKDEPLRIMAGKHQLRMTAPGKDPWIHDFELPPGGQVSIPLPSTATAEVAAAPPSVSTTGTSETPERVPLYVGLLGAGHMVLRPWDLGSNAFISQDGSNRVTPTSSGMGGLRIGYELHPSWDLEGELAYVALPNRLGSSTGLAFGVNGVFEVMGDQSWSPLIEAGAGAYQVVAGPLGSNTDFRAHFGLGVRAHLADWIAIRADVRDVFSDGFDGIGANNLELQAGAEFRFPN
jgi:hypothetical protein